MIDDHDILAAALEARPMFDIAREAEKRADAYAERHGL